MNRLSLISIKLFKGCIVCRSRLCCTIMHDIAQDEMILRDSDIHGFTYGTTLVDMLNSGIASSYLTIRFACFGSDVFVMPEYAL